MSGPIERFMTDDHVELDHLLARADAGEAIDEAAYADFRERLLRHIAMEEKVLLPFAKEKQGAPLAIAQQLRVDHGAIAKLLVPSPTHAICAELRAVFARHNPLEEGPGALYATCDDLAGDESDAIVERLRAQPRVPVAKHYDGPAHERHRKKS